jgi:riboflavin kinase / FMN adenylyltransferase
MHHHYHWQGLGPASRGASVAMGNFDGLHRGHHSVIDLARGPAPLGIVTFEPHPREFFAPDSPPFRLMNVEARANRLAKLGVEQLFQLPFDAESRTLSLARISVSARAARARQPIWPNWGKALAFARPSPP